MPQHTHDAATTPRLLLDSFPLLRSREVQDACTRIGHWFSPHRLELKQVGQHLDVQLNKVALHDTAIHVLRYGAEVTIDPGRRGDFYMLQLPLSGHAQVRSGREQVQVDRNILSVLHPRAPTQMSWSADCSMILLQIPTALILRRTGRPERSEAPLFATAISRDDPRVAAWWAAAESMVFNLDQHANMWLSSAAAVGAMEDFLISSFIALMLPATHTPTLPVSSGLRALARAKEFIHANLTQALTLDTIADYAYASPRNLEQLFRREENTTPMAYVRTERLHAVHQVLLKHQGQGVAQNALAYGFTHMGRFASLYHATYGCYPSETWRRAQ